MSIDVADTGVTRIFSAGVHSLYPPTVVHLFSYRPQ